MINILIIAILIIVVGSASIYIWKAKKKGQKCIGCPCSGTAMCHCHDASKGQSS